jgi:hypothetical protein
MSDAWVIWSEEQHAWVGHGGQHYSNSLMQAGLFADVDAQRLADQANRHYAPGFWRQWAFPDPLKRTV